MCQIYLKKKKLPEKWPVSKLNPVHWGQGRWERGDWLLSFFEKPHLPPQKLHVQGTHSHFPALILWLGSLPQVKSDDSHSYKGTAPQTQTSRTQDLLLIRQ